MDVSEDTFSPFTPVNCFLKNLGVEQDKCFQTDLKIFEDKGFWVESMLEAIVVCY